MKQPDRSPRRSARQRATRRIDGVAPNVRAARFLRRAFVSDGPTFEPLALAAAVLLLVLSWSVLARSFQPAFMPALAPDDAGAALAVLWQAHTAIVGLSIPLLVLLLEQAQSKTVLATTAGHAMVGDSWVVLTTVLSLGSVVEIGLVAVYLESDGALLASIVLATSCVALIIHGYWRALGLLVSPHRLRERSNGVLLLRLRASVRDAFIDSMANDELTDALQIWSPGHVSRTGVRNGDWSIHFADTDGVVSDVDLRRLRDLLNRHVAPVPVGDAATDQDGASATGIQWPISIAADCGVQVLPIGQRVRRGDPVLAVRSPQVRVEQLGGLVTVKPSSTTGDSPFRIETRTLRDQILAAIDGSVLGDVEDGLELYGKLLRAVLEFRAEFSRTTGAPAPVGWFNRDGPEVEWLEEDLRTFIARAWHVQNVDVLGLLSTQLTRLLDVMRRAGELSAHERILRLADVFYWRSLAVESAADDRGSGGRALLRAVRSYGAFQVLFDFELDPATELPFLEQIFDFLARSVKAAIDSDPARAAGALIELEDLLDSLDLHDRGTSPWEMPAERIHFNTYASGYLTAIGGYILLLRSKERLTDAQAKQVLQAHRRSSERSSTIGGLLSALDDRTRNQPWSHWETQLWPDGQSSGTLGELEEWVRVFGLLEITRRNEDRRLAAAVSHLDSFEAEHFVKRLLEAFDSRGADWLPRSYPDYPDAARLDEARSRLREVENELHTATLDERAQMPLSDARIAQFCKSVVGEWTDDERAPIRGDLVVTDMGEPPSDWFGFNSLQPKDFFTESEVVAFPERLGDSIGRGLVRGEIDRILNTLDGLVNEESDLEGLAARVDEWIDTLRNAGREPYIVVVGSWRVVRQLTSDFNFGVGDTTYYRDATVDLVYANHPPACYVVDLSTALDIRRWNATSSDTRERIEADGRLLIDVREIDATYARTLLAQSPNLRQGEDGTVESEQDAIRRLRRFVHVRVWTKLDVQLADPSAGVAIRLTDGAD